MQEPPPPRLVSRDNLHFRSSSSFPGQTRLVAHLRVTAFLLFSNLCALLDFGMKITQRALLMMQNYCFFLKDIIKKPTTNVADLKEHVSTYFDNQ